MKKLFKYILPAALLVMLTNCEKQEIVITEGEALAITLSSDNVVLDQTHDSEIALTVNWTSGTNHKTGAAISYYFEWDVAGNDFQGGVKEDIGKTSSRVKTFTHKELNDSILKTWTSVEAGDAVELEMRITATVADASVPVQVSPVKTFSVTTYKWRPLSLFLVGDATPGGWDNQRATAMTASDDTKGLFTYSGELYAGELKFLTAIGKWLPCYVRYETRQDSMVYRETDESYPDFKWNIENDGTYLIEANVIEQHVTITAVSVHQNVWILGSAAPGGWSLDDAVKMNYDEESGNYTSTCTLTAGELKFTLQKKSFGGEMLFATEADTPVAEDSPYIKGSGDAGTPDYKWVVTDETAGVYDITIYPKTQTVSFVKQ